MDWLKFVEIVAVPAFGAAIGIAVIALRKAQDNSDELNRYKLDVAEKYASIAYLKDVESRLIAALNEIKDAVKDIASEMRDKHGRGTGD